MADEAHREREHFFGAAKLIAALTMPPRVQPLARQQRILHRPPHNHPRNDMTDLHGR